METPIRILSDIHIGHPGSKVTDVRQLAPLIEGARTVIFNGDTYEQRASPLRELGDQMFEELTAMCVEFGAEPIFLRGNHDPDIERAVDHLDLADGKILVTHGDVFYKEISPWGSEIDEMRDEIDEIASAYPDLERISLGEQITMTRAVRQLLKPLPFKSLRSGTFFGTIRSLSNAVWPPHRPALILHTWMTSHRVAYRALLRWRPKARFIIYGHTHFPLVWTPHNRVVINTGSYFGFSGAQMVEIDGGVLKVYPVRRDSQCGTFRPAYHPSQRFSIESPEHPLPEAPTGPSFGIFETGD